MKKLRDEGSILVQHGFDGGSSNGLNYDTVTSLVGMYYSFTIVQKAFLLLLLGLEYWV